MAKRHKNKGNKGNSHGRGMSKTRGRGGAASRGRGSGRGGGRGRGGHHTSNYQEFPELMDLDNNNDKDVFVPVRMIDEVRTTSRSKNQTMSKALRKIPIKFEKAKEAYDPSAELLRKLAEVKIQVGIEEKNDIKVVKQEIETVPVDSITEDIDNAKQLVEEEEQEEEGAEAGEEVLVNIIDEVDESEEDEEPVVETESESEDDRELEPFEDVSSTNEEEEEEEASEVEAADEELFYIDEQGESPSSVKQSTTINPVDLPSNKKPSSSSPSGIVVAESSVATTGGTEFDPDFSIGKVYLNGRIAEDGSLEARIPRLSQYQAAQSYISQIMRNNGMYTAGSGSDDDDDSEDDFGSSEEDFIMNATEESSDNDDDEEEEEEHITSMNDLSINKKKKKKIKEEVKDVEPEYGFLEEDYQFDISCLTIDNVRFGAGSNRQFYARSFKVLGEDDFIWIDGEDLEDMLIDQGMAPHRVEAYYKFVMTNLGLLNDEDPKDQPNYSDVYISETSEEEDDEEELEHDDDDDGMDQLVAYAKSGKLFNNHTSNEDYIPITTTTIKTKGKGSNRRLDFEGYNDMDLTLMESLQDQYLAHKRSRKDKKLQTSALAQNEHNLSAKYSYTMNIIDIKEEFELFLHDSARSALTFPPMDHHGLKTIAKLADFYNMKSRKFGKNLKKHVVVIKNKKTYHSLPYYNEISRVLKQRRVFNRTDVKRTMDEIANSKDGSKSRTGGNGKNKAHVIEGEIVGQLAPEIGQENIGRKMLEKLGWNKGEGLGIDKSGISEPILAKVKTTKLGIK